MISIKKNPSQVYPAISILACSMCSQTDNSGGLKENGFHREWHYWEVWLFGVGVSLMEEVCHYGSGL